MQLTRNQSWYTLTRTRKRLLPPYKLPPCINVKRSNKHRGWDLMHLTVRGGHVFRHNKGLIKVPREHLSSKIFREILEVLERP